jgi:hypothetical protein
MKIRRLGLLGFLAASLAGCSGSVSAPTSGDSSSVESLAPGMVALKLPNMT